MRTDGVRRTSDASGNYVLEGGPYVFWRTSKLEDSQSLAIIFVEMHRRYYYFDGSLSRLALRTSASATAMACAVSSSWLVTKGVFSSERSSPFLLETTLEELTKTRLPTPHSWQHCTTLLTPTDTFDVNDTGWVGRWVGGLVGSGEVDGWVGWSRQMGVRVKQWRRLGHGVGLYGVS